MVSAQVTPVWHQFVPSHSQVSLKKLGPRVAPPKSTTRPFDVEGSQASPTQQRRGGGVVGLALLHLPEPNSQVAFKTVTSGACVLEKQSPAHPPNITICPLISS